MAPRDLARWRGNVPRTASCRRDLYRRAEKGEKKETLTKVMKVKRARGTDWLWRED